MKREPRQAHRVASVVSVVGMYAFITGYSGCFKVSEPNAPYDYITAADSNWAVTGSNSGIDIEPINTNTQPPANLTPDQYSCGHFPNGDPMVRVDTGNRWWFAQIVYPQGTSPGGECLSVSTGADPRGPHYSYLFPGAADGLWLGVTSNKATLTGLFTDGTYKTIVINRADAISGVNPRTATIIHDEGTFYRRPAENVSISYPGPMYLYGPSPAGIFRARIITITGVPGVGNGVSHAWADVPISYSLNDEPSSAMQPDGSYIDFPGITDAIFNNNLWIAHAGRILYVSEFTGLNPFQPIIWQTAQQYPLDPGGQIGCPSLAATQDDNVVVGFATASPSRWLTAYLTGRRSYDPLAQMREPVIAAAGKTQPASPGTHFRLDYCAGALSLDGLAWNVQPFADSFSPNGPTSRIQIVGFDPHSVQ